LHAATIILQFAQDRFSFGWLPYGPFWRRAARAVYMLYFANAILLLVASVALLRWRPWARKALLIWACSSMVLGLAAMVVWYVPYANSLAQSSASTRPGYTSFLMNAWYSLANVLGEWAFPLLVLLILRQPEIAALWAHRSAGFAVIPMAKRTPTV
jgi:hypothetical protein